ncbi:hypothetical protein EMCRGX_G034406 [Ephydatia muelleri]
MKLRMKRSEYCQEEEIADKCDVMINIKELDDVLMKDVGGKIKASGKYGKFVVIDLLDIEDMWTVITQKFDDVYPGLLLDIMKKDRQVDQVDETSVNNKYCCYHVTGYVCLIWIG